MKKIFIITVLMLLISGCSNNKDTTTICKAKNDYEDVEEVIEASGDEVTKYTIIITQDLSKKVDTSIYTDEELKAMYEEQYDGTYDNLKGVTYNVSVEKGILTRELVVDYSKASIKELTDAGLVDGDNKETVDFISLEKTIAASEKQDSTCKEK